MARNSVDTEETERPHPWLSMSLYWLLCATLGHKTGYFDILLGLKDAFSSSSSSSSSSSPFPFSPLFFAAALAATLAPQPLYFAAVSERAERNRPGRRDWPAIATFAVVNSVLETAVFKAAVDFGLVLLPRAKTTTATTTATFFSSSSSLFSLPFLRHRHRPPPFSPPTLLQTLVSFSTLSCYCGLVHALFWDKCAFPPHRPPPSSEIEEEEEERKRTTTTRRARRQTTATASLVTAQQRRRQRSAMDGALALFFPMTAAWHRLLLTSSRLSSSPSSSSSSSVALAAVVLLHAVADFAAAFSLRLRGPRRLR